MIVNPFFFYAMSLCDSLKTTAIVLSIFGGAAVAYLTITYCVWLIDGNWDEEDEAAKMLIKVLRVLYWVFGVSLVCVIVLPSEETLLMMQAANLATTDNVTAVFEALKSAMDYAVSVLK